MLGDTPVGVLEQVATGTASNQAHATNVYFIYTDHLDTPRVITRSPDGQVVWRWDSGGPFGLLPPNDNPAGLGAFTFNLRMPGQYYDKSTNLFYNYFRDYDTKLAGTCRAIPLAWPVASIPTDTLKAILFSKLTLREKLHSSLF